MLTNGLLDALIAGLDPAIHHFGIEIVFTMDARVKPAHDESGFVKLGIMPLPEFGGYWIVRIRGR